MPVGGKRPGAGRKPGKADGSEPEPGTARQDPETGRFVPGNNGGPGRPKGSRNKLGEAFIADLYADWQANGVATIQAVREERPWEYLRVVAGILPKTLDVNVNKFDDVTDDELVRRIRQLDTAIRPFLDSEGEGGAGAGAEAPRRH